MIIIRTPGINGLGKTKGCEEAGKRILKTLDEVYTNEAGKEINIKKLELEEIHLDNSNLEEANKLIYENSLESFYEQDKTIFLGGDHSISFSTVSAFLDWSKSEKKIPCLIVFDAHPDCMAPNKEPTHEEWLRGIIERGFPSENILLVGIRNSDKQELEFMKKNKIKRMSMNQLLEELRESCDTIMEFSHNKELYLSLDIDVLDPVFAPATGYPEPGGLTSRQFFYLIERLNKLKNLKAVDLVEINPSKDKENLTVKTGAKILAEFF